MFHRLCPYSQFTPETPAVSVNQNGFAALMAGVLYSNFAYYMPRQLAFRLQMVPLCSTCFFFFFFLQDGDVKDFKIDEEQNDLTAHFSPLI